MKHELVARGDIKHELASSRDSRDFKGSQISSVISSPLLQTTSDHGESELGPNRQVYELP